MPYTLTPANSCSGGLNVDWSSTTWRPNGEWARKNTARQMRRDLRITEFLTDGSLRKLPENTRTRSDQEHNTAVYLEDGLTWMPKSFNCASLTGVGASTMRSTARAVFGNG